jgi:hypothetical protein
MVPGFDAGIQMTIPCEIDISRETSVAVFISQEKVTEFHHSDGWESDLNPCYANRTISGRIPSQWTVSDAEIVTAINAFLRDCSASAFGGAIRLRSNHFCFIFLKALDTTFLRCPCPADGFGEAISSEAH